MGKNKLPYIFIFDIDNCIIGNVEYPIYEYELMQLIKNNCNKKDVLKKCKKYIDFVKELKQGLLRPYFSEFIKFIKKTYKTCEIYVYTNSSYTWTYNGLVYNIEKAAKMKFNKPYFTRDYSHFDMSKSLTNVLNVIFKKLKKKYPLLNYKKFRYEVFNNRLIFIDNIKDNLADFPNKQLTCPEYKFNKKYNVLNKILRKYKIKKSELNKKEINNYINTKLLINKNKKNNTYKDIFFKKLIKQLKKINKNINNKNIKKLNFELN